MDRVHSELQNVFRRIFNDDELVITDGTKAADIDGWELVGAHQFDHRD